MGYYLILLTGIAIQELVTYVLAGIFIICLLLSCGVFIYGILKIVWLFIQIPLIIISEARKEKRERKQKEIMLMRKAQEEKMQAKAIKANFPDGFYEWIKKTKTPNPSNKVVIYNESIIKELDDKIKLAMRYESWKTFQDRFSEICIESKSCRLFEYSYNIDWGKIDREGLNVHDDYKISQMFPYGVCFETDLDYSNEPQIQDLSNRLTQIKNCNYQLNNFCYQTIADYIIKLNERIGADLDIKVLFNIENQEWKDCAWNYHFEPLKEKLGEASIFYTSNLSDIATKGIKCVVIVEMFTENDTMKAYCEKVIDALGMDTLILYISCIKCYTRNEMLKIIKNDKELIYKEKLAKIEPEYKRICEQYPNGVEYISKYWNDGRAIQEIVVENENKIAKYDRIYPKYKILEKEYPHGLATFIRETSWDDGKNYASLSMEEILNCTEEVKKIETQFREQEEKLLLYKVKNWKSLPNGLHYSYFFPYYPTTCNFELTEEESKNNQLVWDFKNAQITMGSSNVVRQIGLILNYRKALGILVPLISKELKLTFNADLAELTLVCIPASTEIDNKRRYRGFSEALATETGMLNAFNHIRITHDATPKHLGGTGNPTLEFDEYFFKDKFVLLFDDVITSGRSMMTFKNRLEKMGAKVIAGMSIGKTKHQRTP